MTKPDVWSERLATGWIYWPACLAGVAMVALAILGPEAERRIAVEQQCAAMQAEVDALAQTRDQLAAAEKALQNDPQYTERVVRHELGIVRPGEMRMPQKVKPAAAPADAAPPRQENVPPIIKTVAMFSDPNLRLMAMVVGAALLTSGILFSLPGKNRVQSSK